MAKEITPKERFRRNVVALLAMIFFAGIIIFFLVIGMNESEKQSEFREKINASSRRY